MFNDEKIGRNEPCPCGSGKKFKKCCYGRKENEESQEHMDPLWRSVRRAIKDLPSKLVDFSEKHYGMKLILGGWSDFNSEGETGSPPLDPFHFPVFFSWFFYNWTSDPYSESYISPKELEDQTISHLYLKKEGKGLDPLAVKYIEACQRAAFSFHDILSVTPGTGFRLRDIMTGETFDVFEQSASREARPGDILFGNVVRVEHLALLDCCSTYMIPVEAKPRILQERIRIRSGFPQLTSEDLREYDFELLDLYHEFIGELRNPVPPIMMNTDNEPVILHHLTYEINSSERTFEALKALSITMTEEEMRRSGIANSNGEVVEADINWEKTGNAVHSGWESTMLGTLHIEGRTLTVQTNSDERARTIRGIIEERLSGETRLIKDEILPAKDLAAGKIPDTFGMKKGMQTAPLDPETRKAIQEASRKHFIEGVQQWPHRPIPLLEGKTPLEAVQTEEGREMVESLLLVYEQRSLASKMPVDSGVFSEIRALLGL